MRSWTAIEPESGLYEQFAGFFELEPLVISEIAPRRPIAADLLLSPERVHRAQVVKQADVLMLHHLVPDEVAAGSLAANLAFYEPRTAHASSLSPGVHAALFARAGRLAQARAALELATRIDLDDVSGSTAGGVHIAAMGSVWQALALGFAGARPREDMLELDPRLAPEWELLELRLRFRAAQLKRAGERGRDRGEQRPPHAPQRRRRRSGDRRARRCALPTGVSFGRHRARRQVPRDRARPVVDRSPDQHMLPMRRASAAANIVP